MRQAMRQAFRRWFSYTILLAAAPLALAACRHHAAETKPLPAPVGAATDVPLEIANHNWLDVIIYVIRDGQPTRLGIAGASSSATFTVPARLLSQGHEIRLWGHPIGGTGGTLTESVVVQPGQWIEWTLESDLDRSAIGVY
jgi:hypothetical protein